MKVFYHMNKIQTEFINTVILGNPDSETHSNKLMRLLGEIPIEDLRNIFQSQPTVIKESATPHLFTHLILKCSLEVVESVIKKLNISFTQLFNNLAVEILCCTFSNIFELKKKLEPVVLAFQWIMSDDSLAFYSINYLEKEENVKNRNVEMIKDFLWFLFDKNTVFAKEPGKQRLFSKHCEKCNSGMKSEIPFFRELLTRVMLRLLEKKTIIGNDCNADLINLIDKTSAENLSIIFSCQKTYKIDSYETYLLNHFAQNLSKAKNLSQRETFYFLLNKIITSLNFSCMFDTPVFDSTDQTLLNLILGQEFSEKYPSTASSLFKSLLVPLHPFLLDNVMTYLQEQVVKKTGNVSLDFKKFFVNYLLGQIDTQSREGNLENRLQEIKVFIKTHFLQEMNEYQKNNNENYFREAHKMISNIPHARKKYRKLAGEADRKQGPIYCPLPEPIAYKGEKLLIRILN